MRINMKDQHFMYDNMTVNDKNAPQSLKNEEMLLNEEAEATRHDKNMKQIKRERP